MKVEQLKLAKEGTPARRPVEFDFAAEHDLRNQSGTLQRGAGKALSTLTGTYNRRGDFASLRMNLSGPDMPVPELEEMLPALGIVLPARSSLQGGTADAKLSLEVPGLSNTRLAGFDLGAKMSAIERLAGIKSGPNSDIRTLSAIVRVAPEGSSAQDIKLIAPSIGELNGAGTISPSHALDFKMRVTLHKSGGVLAALGQKGDTSVPFTIQGTSSDPVFRPDVGAIATKESNASPEETPARRQAAC